MPVLEDGTMRETMDELGHTNVSVAVDSYQRVVREYHPRDEVEGSGRSCWNGIPEYRRTWTPFYRKTEIFKNQNR